MSDREWVSVDTFAHTNPAFVAATTSWIADAFWNERGTGVAVPWCLVGVALLAPDNVRSEMPSTARKRLSNLMREHVEWRNALAEAMRLWVPMFWSGVAYGVATGALTVEAGRLTTLAPLQSPDSALSSDLRRKAHAFGRILAREGSDDAIGLALGVRISL